MLSKSLLLVMVQHVSGSVCLTASLYRVIRDTGGGNQRCVGIIDGYKSHSVIFGIAILPSVSPRGFAAQSPMWCQFVR